VVTLLTGLSSNNDQPSSPNRASFEKPSPGGGNQAGALLLGVSLLGQSTEDNV
jgi:hypothetical protein